METRLGTISQISERLACLKLLLHSMLSKRFQPCTLAMLIGMCEEGRVSQALF